MDVSDLYYAPTPFYKYEAKETLPGENEREGIPVAYEEITHIHIKVLISNPNRRKFQQSSQSLLEVCRERSQPLANKHPKSKSKPPIVGKITNSC